MIPIEQAWCRETSADPDGWSEDNRALGQMERGMTGTADPTYTAGTTR